MIKLQTALLAAALAAPFGLAIHEDATRDKRPEFAPQAESFDDLFRGQGDEPFYRRQAAMERRLALAEAARAEAEMRAEQDALEAAERDALGDDGEHLEAQSRTLAESELEKLFGQERAVMGPALAGLRFRMTAAEVQKHAPEVRAWSERSDELGKAQVYLEYLIKSDTRLSTVRVEVYDGSGRVESFLRKRWGEPQIADSGDGVEIWINEDKGVRAALPIGGRGDELAVEFSQIRTPGSLFDRSKKKRVFAFETNAPLLGIAVKQLERSYPDVVVDPYYHESAVLDLAGISVDPRALPITKVTMNIADGKVGQVSFGFSCGDSCESALAAIARDLGEPASSDEDAGTTVYGTSPKVTVEFDPDVGVIDIVATP